MPRPFLQVLVEQLHAVHVFCGKDFRFGVGAGWGVDDLCAFGASMGFQVHPVEPVLCGGSKISSTMIRRLLQAGKPEEAAQLLGAPYQLCSLVEHGAALGRTKAVPTINMDAYGGVQLVFCHQYRRKADGQRQRTGGCRDISSGFFRRSLR